MQTFRVTWETYTDASVEAGDAEERGFIDPRYEERVPIDKALNGDKDRFDMSLRSALDCLSLIEPADLNGIDPCDRWLSFHYTCWGQGPIISETRTLHFPENITPSSRSRLVRLLSS